MKQEQQCQRQGNTAHHYCGSRNLPCAPHLTGVTSHFLKNHKHAHVPIYIRTGLITTKCYRIPTMGRALMGGLSVGHGTPVSHKYTVKSVEFSKGYDRFFTRSVFSRRERFCQYRTRLFPETDAGREPSENIMLSAYVAPLPSVEKNERRRKRSHPFLCELDALFGFGRDKKRATRTPVIVARASSEINVCRTGQHTCGTVV